MQLSTRSAGVLIKTLRGQISCAERLLVEISCTYGETIAPVPGDDEKLLEKIGDQCFELLFQLEVLHNEIDDFGDRLREATGQKPSPPYRQRDRMLQALKRHMRDSIEECEVTRAWSEEKKEELLERYDWDAHLAVSRALARKRA